MELVMEGQMAICGPHRASQSRTKKKDPAPWALHGCARWRPTCTALPPWPACDLHSLCQPALTLANSWLHAEILCPGVLWDFFFFVFCFFF